MMMQLSRQSKHSILTEGATEFPPENIIICMSFIAVINTTFVANPEVLSKVPGCSQCIHCIGQQISGSNTIKFFGGVFDQLSSVFTPRPLNTTNFDPSVIHVNI